MIILSDASNPANLSLLAQLYPDALKLVDELKASTIEGCPQPGQCLIRGTTGPGAFCATCLLSIRLKPLMGEETDLSLAVVRETET